MPSGWSTRFQSCSSCPVHDAATERARMRDEYVQHAKVFGRQCETECVILLQASVNHQSDSMKKLLHVIMTITAVVLLLPLLLLPPMMEDAMMMTGAGRSRSKCVERSCACHSTCHHDSTVLVPQALCVCVEYGCGAAHCSSENSIVAATHRFNF